MATKTSSSWRWVRGDQTRVAGVDGPAHVLDHDVTQFEPVLRECLTSRDVGATRRDERRAPPRPCVEPLAARRRHLGVPSGSSEPSDFCKRREYRALAGDCRLRFAQGLDAVEARESSRELPRPVGRDP